MKITIPWQIRLTGSKSRSPRRGNWWNRKPFKETTPAARSVTMKEDDLDHLGALHHVIENRSKR